MPALFTGFGLSGAAGLNAYVPLMALALLGRFGAIHLAEPFDVITRTWALIVIGLFLCIELVVDKIPGVDHVNDVVQTFVRPAAGALVFAASAGAVDFVPTWLALVLGLVLAFSVHATKAVTRPAVNVTTAGFGAPFVSALEDALSLITTLVAILLPYLVAACLLVIAGTLVWLWRRKRRAKQPAAA
jgi:hypothetical protein